MAKIGLKIVNAVVGGVLSISVFAADIPQVDIESQDFNQEQCVDDNTQTCINDQCLTSEATDCQAQCQKQAQAVCQQQADD
ncbi:hypothetical protein [Legionella sp. km772]|uniref:hypothetical protein n=1 Tax=Legionella sp. km772 TaxID=2498111 RepID=UPI000F8C508F|nr:hypothetical protein [Legionella sp. km772]RUR05937.1 hypothetical protein ELY15_13735 [Legionella sp. km772]